MTVVKLLSVSLTTFLFLFGISVSAKVPLQKGPSLEQLKKIHAHHDQLSKLNSSQSTLDAPDVRPFVEFERSGYVVINNGFLHNSAEAKARLARHLPSDMELVVLISSEFQRTSTENFFNQYISSSRLHILVVPDAHLSFWARDALPVPVINSSGGLKMVDAQYFHGFSSDQFIASTFNAGISQHSYYFEGGNFLPNTNGECYLVQFNTALGMPDWVLRDHYGCQEVIRLPYRSGIGHVDEHIKFLSESHAITDNSDYANTLRDRGYTVSELPVPETPFGTYANSLLVNGTIFMPVYGESTDSVAKNKYESLGYTVVEIPSVELSSIGTGSIHCITMNYPRIPIDSLKRALGAF